MISIRFLPSSDDELYIVKIKMSFVLFKLYNAAQCHFAFQVLVIKRKYIFIDYLILLK